MKRIYVNNEVLSEAVAYLNNEITFFGFLSHTKAFLKELLVSPLTADIDDYLKDNGLERETFISSLLSKNILEKETKIETQNDSDKFMISYKVPKRNFERKIRRLYATLFEQNEIQESRLFENQTKLLAPNGKVSNLPENLWRLVRTPQFKQWFGDWENNPEQSSKVVDENGEPLIMIHNTKEAFEVFDTERGINKMSYFADAHGSNYVGGFVKGNINMSVFLNMRKPCNDIENGAYAREEGYDGILVQDTIDGKMGTYAAVYSANQIKSIDNRGMFSNDKTNIYETDCGMAMQGGGTNPDAGQFVTPIGKVQRRRIYVTNEQLDIIKETATSDAGDYQYDVPLNFNNGKDPAYNHTNMIAKGIPNKKIGIRQKKK
jgi:hypothetical protein